MGAPGERLVAATDAERRGRDDLTWPEWGQNLSLPLWREREIFLRAHPWSMAAMETWLWKDAAGRTLSSCETFRTFARRGTDAGEVYAVASVFTEASLRGHGHATAMIDALNLGLMRRPRALGSVLFSDVGARIYQRSGYQPFPAREVVLPASVGVPTAGVEPVVAPFEEPPPPAPLPAMLTLLPSAPQLDWHLARERFYSRALNRQGAAFHGARAGAASAYWVASLKANVLQVLWLQPGSASETQAVLASAQAIAAAAGLDSVRVWEPHDGFSGLPGPRVERDGELPMLRAYGPGQVQWKHIHRAGWV